MEINNDLFRLLASEHQNGMLSEVELYSFFISIKPYLKLHTYIDYSGVLESCDIEAIAFLGFIKAINKFDSSRCENPVGWVYQIVSQSIVKEIKKVTKKGNTAINSHMSVDLRIEDFGDNLIDSAQSEVFYSDAFINNLFRIYEKLYEVNIKAAKVFTLKLIFPNLSRDTIANILGFKRRNAIAKLIRIIETVGAKNINRNIIEDEQMTFKEPIYEIIDNKYNIMIDKVVLFVAYQNNDGTWNFISLLEGVRGSYILESKEEIKPMVNNTLKRFINKFMTKI